MNFAKYPSSKRIVSLTPLIDVVFILLIFFMLVSQYSQWSHIDVSAPAPSSKPQNQYQGSIMVRIDENSRIDVAGSPKSLPQLETHILALKSKNPEQAILIKPAEKLPVQDLIVILDVLRKTGINNFSIIR